MPLILASVTVATSTPVRGDAITAEKSGTEKVPINILSNRVDTNEYPAASVAEITTQLKVNNLKARQTWMGRKVTLNGYFQEVRPDTLRSFQHILRRDERYRNVMNSGMLLSFGEESPGKRFKISERPNTFMAYIGLDPNGAGTAFNRDEAVSVSGIIIQVSEGMVILDPISIFSAKSASVPGAAVNPSHEELLSKLKQPKLKIRTTPKLGVVEKKTLSDAMLAAAKANEWDSVFEALEGGASANTRNEGTRSNIISYLALDQKLSNEKRLSYTTKALEYGVSADGGNTRNTPLIQAILRNDFELTLLLLRHDADSNQPTDLALRSPLKTARKTGNQKIVDLLIAAGASDDK